MSAEKLDALSEWANSALFDEPERLALDYAERITRTDDDVDEDLFTRLRSAYTPEEIVELTCTVAFENFLSKFHHALLVESQGFCLVASQVPHEPLSPAHDMERISPPD